MVFSDLVFLYIFFPLTFLLYFIGKKRGYRNAILLIFSLIFYSWTEPKYILLMLLASLVAYLSGLLQDNFMKKKKYFAKKVVFILTVIFLLGNLLFFKYLNFIGRNLASLFNINISIPQILLPIGISFYTFQILSYVIDLYLEKIKVQKNYFNLTLYISFFPQLIAGPIVRYQTIEEEILNRKENFDDVIIGLKRFIVGLSKKVILANNLGLISEIIYGANDTSFGTIFYWVASISYAMQIYFDFSGYSDMAIGLGRVFGFHFLENFNYPYISLSVTEFWKRWHISLASWFRDYVYIPLGGNKVGQAKWIFNVFIVWFLTGFWHGAEWNYIAWGIYYFFFLLFEKYIIGKHLEKLPKLVRWIYAIIIMNVGMVIFNSSDFTKLFHNLSMMFTYYKSDFIGAIAYDVFIVKAFIYVPLGILCSFPILAKYKYNPRNKDIYYGLENIFYIILLMINITFIVSSTFNPFIYFRF